MVTLNNVGQKVKGQAQQIKGELEEVLGFPLKGKTNILKGKANMFGADLKSKVENKLDK